MLGLRQRPPSLRPWHIDHGDNHVNDKIQTLFLQPAREKQQTTKGERNEEINRLSTARRAEEIVNTSSVLILYSGQPGRGSVQHNLLSHKLTSWPVWGLVIAGTRDTKSLPEDAKHMREENQKQTHTHTHSHSRTHTRTHTHTQKTALNAD